MPKREDIKQVVEQSRRRQIAELLKLKKCDASQLHEELRMVEHDYETELLTSLTPPSDTHLSPVVRAFLEGDISRSGTVVFVYPESRLIDTYKNKATPLFSVDATKVPELYDIYDKMRALSKAWLETENTAQEKYTHLLNSVKLAKSMDTALIQDVKDFMETVERTAERAKARLKESQEQNKPTDTHQNFLPEVLGIRYLND